MGARGLGGRGRGVCGTWGRRGRAPTVEETEGEDLWKHYTTHTVIVFSHAQLIFFRCFLGPGGKHVRTELLAWLG